MQPYTAQDVTATGVAVSLATITGIQRCRWFQVSATAVASTPARVGPSTVALDVASPAVLGTGFPIGPGAGQFSPPVSLMTETYDLTLWFLIGVIGDTFSVGVVV